MVDHAVVIVLLRPAEHMLIDAQGRDPVEPAGSVDQTTPTLGENRTVRGMPGHPQTGRGAGPREMVAHDRRQRPPEPAG